MLTAMALGEPSLAHSLARCFFTRSATSSARMSGTSRSENLPLTARGITVLAPGSLKAPSTPCNVSVGHRHRAMSTSALDAFAPALSWSSEASPASPWAKELTSKSMSAYRARSSSVTGGTRSRTPATRIRSWCSLAPFGTDGAGGGASATLRPESAAAAAASPPAAPPSSSLESALPSSASALVAGAVAAPGGSTSEAMRWHRSSSGSWTVPPKTPECRSLVPPATSHSK
mmetsp:Transcript_34566/g.78158  ORF Transcript_34566/g.78158 Transcript_34566/m.78158 type:complete len:231 (-) Transcript_34566:151-843(-)